MVIGSPSPSQLKRKAQGHILLYSTLCLSLLSIGGCGYLPSFGSSKNAKSEPPESFRSQSVMSDEERRGLALPTSSQNSYGQSSLGQPKGFNTELLFTEKIRDDNKRFVLSRPYRKFLMTWLH